MRISFFQHLHAKQGGSFKPVVLNVIGAQDENPWCYTRLQRWGRWAHGAGFRAFLAGATAPPRGASLSPVLVITAREALQTDDPSARIIATWTCLQERRSRG